MTETVFADMMSTQGQDFDAMAPENVSPLVVGWARCSRVASPARCSRWGRQIRVAEGWAHGPDRQGRPLGSRRTGPGGQRAAGEGTPAVPVYGA